MTKTEIAQEALQLPEQDRYDLIHTLWASLEELVASSAPISSWQQGLLDERLVAAGSDPGQSWLDVRNEIWPSAE